MALLQLVILTFLFVHNRVALPDFALTRAYSWLDAHGLYPRWESISVDLTGGVLVQGVELKHGSGELVARADAVFADLNVFTLLTGYGSLFEGVSVRNLQLFEPALLSGTGMNELMWQGPEMVIEKRGHQLFIERFLMRDGNDSLSLSGTLNLNHLPSREMDESGVSINDWEGAWHQLARAGRLRRQLKSVADPLWTEVLLHAGDTFTAVQIRAHCTELRLSGILDWGADFTANRLSLDARLVLDREGLHIAPSSLTAREVSARLPEVGKVSGVGWDLRYSAEHPIRLNLAKLLGFDLAPEALQVSVEMRKRDAEPLVFAVDWVQWDQPQSVAAVWSPGKQISDVAVDLRLQVEPLLRHPKVEMTEVDEMLSLNHPVRLTGQFYPGASLQESRFEGFFGIEQMTVKEAYFETARGRIAINGQRALVYEASALNPLGQRAYGGYVQYFDPLDFRIFARGTIDPRVLDSLLDDWWLNLWRNMSLQGPPAYGDVDVFGRWRQTELVQARVFARGEQAMYRDQAVRALELDLYHQRGYVDISRIHAEAEQGGTFAGALLWVFPRDETEPMHSFFDIRSDLPLPVFMAALGQDAESLDWVQVTESPFIHLQGQRLESRLPDSEESVLLPQQIAIAARAGQGDLQGIPFQSMDLRLRIQDSVLASESINMSVFSGSVTGSLYVTDYQNPTSPVRLSLVGNALSYGDVAVWLGGNENRGTLGFHLDVTGLRGQPDSITGAGALSIMGADFGRIRVLGPLTRLLDGIGLNFSSFALNTATATFEVNEQRRVVVPDLRIEGPSANLQAQGELFLATQNLDFDVRVFLMDTPTFTLRSIVGLVLRPLAHVLELRVSGAIDEPNWRFRNNPFNFLLPNVDPVTTVAPEMLTEE